MKITQKHIDAVDATIVDYSPPYIAQKTQAWHSVSTCVICEVANVAERDNCEYCLYYELVRRGMLKLTRDPNGLYAPVCTLIEGAPSIPRPCDPVSYCRLWRDVEHVIQEIRHAKARADWLSTVVKPMLLMAKRHDERVWRIGDQIAPGYMLCQVNEKGNEVRGQVCIIDIHTGSAKSPIVEVDDVFNVKPREMVEMGGTQFLTEEENKDKKEKKND